MAMGKSKTDSNNLNEHDIQNDLKKWKIIWENYNNLLISKIITKMILLIIRYFKKLL